jgi:hypothetical protein
MFNMHVDLKAPFGSTWGKLFLRSAMFLRLAVPVALCVISLLSAHPFALNSTPDPWPPHP